MVATEDFVTHCNNKIETKKESKVISTKSRYQITDDDQDLVFLFVFQNQNHSLGGTFFFFFFFFFTPNHYFF